MSSETNVISCLKEFSKFFILNNAKVLMQESSQTIKSSWALNDIVSGKTENIIINYIVDNNCSVISKSPVILQNNEIIFDRYSNCGFKRATCFERQVNETQGDSKGNMIYIWSKDEFVKCINLKEMDMHGLIYKKDFNFGDLQWLSNGSSIVYIAESKKAKRISHFQFQPQNKNDGTIGDQFLTKEKFGEQLDHIESPVLCVLDVENEKINIIDNIPPEYVAGHICVHPFYEGFVIMAYKKTPYQLGLIYCLQRCSELFYYDMNTKSISQIGSEGKSVMSPRFSPDGKKLIWMENDAHGPHMQCQRLMCYNWTTQTTTTVVDIVRNCPQGFPGIYNLGLVDNCWHTDNRHVFLTSLDRGENKIVVVDIDTHLIRTLDPENSRESTTLLDIHHGRLLIKVSSPSVVPYLAISDVSDVLEFGKLSLKPISDIHKIDNLEWQFLEHTPTFNHPKYGTSQYRSILISPTNFEKTPLILALHGGPHSSFSNEFVLFFAAAAKLGFSSLLVNYRGSFGGGQDFIESLTGYIGTMDVSDCIDACEDSLRRFESKLDSSNVFLYGGSHGGFLATHLSSKYSHRVRAMACRNPVINIPSMITTSDIPDWAYVESGLSWDHKNIPTDDQMLKMWNMSPIRYVDGIHCPVLILIGKVDLRVPPSQGNELARALMARGVLCEQHIYPKDCHPLSSNDATSDCFVNVLSWFSKYITVQ